MCAIQRNGSGMTLSLEQQYHVSCQRMRQYDALPEWAQDLVKIHGNNALKLYLMGMRKEKIVEQLASQ